MKKKSLDLRKEDLRVLVAEEVKFVIGGDGKARVAVSADTCCLSALTCTTEATNKPPMIML